VPVPFKPLVHLTTADAAAPDGRREDAASVVHYTNGLVHTVRCSSDPSASSGQWLSVSSVIYAHRAIRTILVQEVRVNNPTAENVRLNVERLGILDWKGAESKMKT
jgi:hypothetical protein